ncbi:MAG: hypothetical protein AB7T40_04345 [Alphaproteobacteria bacterium]
MPGKAADLVVVASNAPVLSAGQIIDSRATVDLQPGMRVTFIAGDGKSLTRAGPYNGIIWDEAMSGDRALLQSLVTLVSGQSRNRSTLAAMRQPSVSEPSDPWLINVERTGDYCVAASMQPVLWRATANSSATLLLSSTMREGKATVEWPTGVATAAWPSSLVLIDGEAYFAQPERSPTARRLVIHVVPSLATDAHRAVWMAGIGCLEQARLLLKAASN